VAGRVGACSICSTCSIFVTLPIERDFVGVVLLSR